MKMPVGFTLSLISININVGPLAESTAPTVKQRVDGLRSKLVSLKRAAKYRVQRVALSAKEKVDACLGR